jgi:hypothetical protein
MFLVEIDEETGFVSEKEFNSGWKAIKAFNEVYKKKGIKGFTVVALACDYFSPLKHYSTKDRPYRACEEVFGRRNSINFDSELMKTAIATYLELQIDPDLEMEKVNREIKTRLLGQLTDANNDDDDSKVEKYRKSLANHEESIQSFNKNFDKKEAIGRAVTTNGYELSRIENDIKSRKNSKFKQHGDGVINPDKLGLNSKT